jgi:hypothetical protein
MTVLFAVLAAVYSSVFLAMAAVFGLSAYFVWYHASGRLARRLYRGVEGRADPGAGGFGPGPRPDWEPPGQGGRVGAGVGRGRRTGGRTGRARRDVGDEPSAREAYETLDLDPEADEAAVRAAYRRKVKEVHPDQPGGDEERFKQVQAAYDRLRD